MCARELVGDEPFAVMVGDDLMFSGVPGIGQLIEVAMAEKMPVIGVMEVPWEKVSRYGIIDGEEVAPGVYRVRDMVEKPKREEAPSRMAIVGRYVLTPDIFDYLEKVKPGHGGEIQLTDALQAMAKERGMMAVRMAGMRFDAGDWAEFLSANIYFALQDESLRYELLGNFDKAMIALIRKYDVLEGGMPRCLRQHEDDQILAFEKKGCVFVFNFHPTRSQTGLFVPVPEKGDYQVILSTDDKTFGGYQNIDKSVVYHTWAHDPQMGDGFVIYLPARTAVVLRKIDK